MLRIRNNAFVDKFDTLSCFNINKAMKVLHCLVTMVGFQQQQKKNTSETNLFTYLINCFRSNRKKITKCSIFSLSVTFITAVTG
jgi:hypothetical protein